MTEKKVIRIEGPLLTPEQDQIKWLGEATIKVKQKSSEMKLSIDEGNIIKVINSSATLIGELRTGMLNPPTYYELYCRVFDELQSLEIYFNDEIFNKKKTKINELYELVQHVGNIIPRLYLMITIGVIFIKTREAPVKEILRDLIEMCKGVQHPTRGMFLRHYLLTMVKSKLPDINSDDYSEEEGSLEDSIEFILQNLKEMNWLWVRMEAVKNLKYRKSNDERKEIRILVGYNIVRLSQLEGITKKGYSAVILPRLLEIIMLYKEPLAQQYLLEVIIQVFPDEYHLYTLEDFILSFVKVCVNVDICSVLSTLMDRLGNYVVAQREGTTEAGGGKKEMKIIEDMFEILSKGIVNISENNVKLFSGASFVETCIALIKLAVKTYPDEYNNISNILIIIKNWFKKPPNPEAVKALKKLLTYIMNIIKDSNILLELTDFDTLIDLLPFKARRDVVISLCTAISNNDGNVNTFDGVAKLFDIISPIIRAVADTPEDPKEIYSDDYEFAEEQNLVCRTLHKIDNDDCIILIKMLNGIRKQLGQGGPQRLKYTLRAMIFSYLKAALKIKKQIDEEVEVGVDITKPFSYIQDPDGKGKGLLDYLANESPEQCFYIYLSCANTADVCECIDISYAFFASAFSFYESNAPNTHEQIKMMSAIISGLICAINIPEEYYETFTTKACQLTSGFLHKHDQALIASYCSNLFNKKGLSDNFSSRVIECMSRASKLAGNAVAVQQPAIFVEIFNQYLHLFAGKVSLVDHNNISKAIDMVREANVNAEAVDNNNNNNNDLEKVKVFYRNTMRYIRSRASQDPRWEEIEI